MEGLNFVLPIEAKNKKDFLRKKAWFKKDLERSLKDFNLPYTRASIMFCIRANALAELAGHRW